MSKLKNHDTRYGSTEVVNVLLEAGVDVNAKNKTGVTALFSASIKGHTEVVKMLLEVGADVNAKNKDGYTALGLASLMSQPKSMEVLFEAGGRSK